MIRRCLGNWIGKHASDEHYLFTLQDLRSLCPELSENAFKTTMSRMASAGYLIRICRGLYAHRASIPATGLFLFHVAAVLRASMFNYISLETVLSDCGIISQIPMQWITLMSSGRNGIISCGEFGTVEFIHTRRKPTDIMQQLSYDARCGLWRASPALALRDMKITHRNCDLIDWDAANEFI